MTEQILHFVQKPKYTIVSKNKVIQLKYALFDATDRILEYRDDLTYLHGGYGGAFPKVEQSLEGLEVGMKCEVQLTPREGFGIFNPFLVMTEPALHFPPEAQQIGIRLDGETPTGEMVKFTVTKVENGMVTVDGNHPYAGKTVKFVFEVADIRTATAKELELGYAVKKKE
ncbi:fkbp-type peptidyl-prolyl cis-trans isomerase [Beggiatoa sp. PS]|nr:fkbp-type peptidyl-prolyl cis-trans isomerase [Beggiatoa sp. PS]